jgi:hypothetical protein
MNAHGDALGEADPLEGRIGIDEKFGAAGVVAIGDAAGDALDMPAQCRAAVEEMVLEEDAMGRAARDGNFVAWI